MVEERDRLVDIVAPAALSRFHATGMLLVATAADAPPPPPPPPGLLRRPTASLNSEYDDDDGNGAAVRRSAAATDCRCSPSPLNWCALDRRSDHQQAATAVVPTRHSDSTAMSSRGRQNKSPGRPPRQIDTLTTPTRCAASSSSASAGPAASLEEAVGQVMWRFGRSISALADRLDLVMMFLGEFFDSGQLLASSAGREGGGATAFSPESPLASPPEADPRDPPSIPTSSLDQLHHIAVDGTAAMEDVDDDLATATGRGGGVRKRPIKSGCDVAAGLLEPHLLAPPPTRSDIKRTLYTAWVEFCRREAVPGDVAVVPVGISSPWRSLTAVGQEERRHDFASPQPLRYGSPRKYCSHSAPACASSTSRPSTSSPSPSFLLVAARCLFLQLIVAAKREVLALTSRTADCHRMTVARFIREPSWNRPLFPLLLQRSASASTHAALGIVPSPEPVALTVLTRRMEKVLLSPIDACATSAPTPHHGLLPQSRPPTPRLEPPPVPTPRASSLVIAVRENLASRLRRLSPQARHDPRARRSDAAKAVTNADEGERKGRSQRTTVDSSPLAQTTHRSQRRPSSSVTPVRRRADDAPILFLNATTRQWSQAASEGFLRDLASWTPSVFRASPPSAAPVASCTVVAPHSIGRHVGDNTSPPPSTNTFRITEAEKVPSPRSAATVTPSLASSWNMCPSLLHGSPLPSRPLLAGAEDPATTRGSSSFSASTGVISVSPSTSPSASPPGAATAPLSDVLMVVFSDTVASTPVADDHAPPRLVVRGDAAKGPTADGATANSPLEGTTSGGRAAARSDTSFPERIAPRGARGRRRESHERRHAGPDDPPLNRQRPLSVSRWLTLLRATSTAVFELVMDQTAL